MRNLFLFALVLLFTLPLYSQSDKEKIEYKGVSYISRDETVGSDGRTSYTYLFSIDAKYEKAIWYNKAAILFELIRNDNEYFTEENRVLILGGFDSEYVLYDGGSIYVESNIEAIKSSSTYEEGTEFMIGGRFDPVMTNKYYIAVNDYKDFDPYIRNLTILYYND